VSYQAGAILIILAMLAIPFIPAGHDWIARLERWDYERHFED
jgi:hypothetical protein